ncbi:MAG: TetR/AcrR family transcriptional regulator, partial [Asticcacaulis sp.]
MPSSDAPAGTPGRKPRRTRSIDPRQFMEAATTLYTNNRARFATVAEITQEIGCAKGTFYLYYRSVEQMYARIIEAKLTECVDETLRRIDAAATLSPQTALSPDTLADAIVSPFLVDKVQINFAFRLIGGFTEMLAREDALNLRLCVVALMRRIADRIEQISQGLLSGEGAR